jgi:hypothetical protein
MTVRVTEADSTETVRTPFLFIGNNEYVVEGIRLGARASWTRAGSTPTSRCGCARDLPKLVALTLNGRAKRRTLKVFAAEKLIVAPSRSRRVKVALDGEVTVMTTALHDRARPRA